MPVGLDQAPAPQFIPVTSTVKDDQHACGHHGRTHQNDRCAANEVGHSQPPSKPSYFVEVMQS